MIYTKPSECDMFRWIKRNAQDFADYCGVVNATKLAEACVDVYQEWSRLDDDQDIIWDMAVDAATRYEERMQ